MEDFLNYKLDLSNKQFDSLVEWLKSLGLEVQTEFEVPMIKSEDVQICPLSDPDPTFLMYSPLIYTNNLNIR